MRIDSALIFCLSDNLLSLVRSSRANLRPRCEGSQGALPLPLPPFPRWHLGTPKNGKTRRVDMSQGLAKTLEAWCETQALEAAAKGQQPSEIVFVGNLGGKRRQPYYMAENWLRYKLWDPLLERAKVRRLTPHATRHTFASRLIANNEPLKYIREQLGHSSITVTADIYGHLIPGANRQAVDRLDILPEEKAPVGYEGACLDLQPCLKP